MLMEDKVRRIKDAFASKSSYDYYNMLQELGVPAYEENGELRKDNDIDRDLILKIMDLTDEKINEYAFDILVCMFKETSNKKELENFISILKE